MCLFLQRWYFRMAYAQHINILDLGCINFVNMCCIDITLGGSRKVKVGLRENVYLHLDTWRHPHLCSRTCMHHCSHLIKDSGGLQFQIRIPSALVLLTLVPNITR